MRVRGMMREAIDEEDLIEAGIRLPRWLVPEGEAVLISDDEADPDEQVLDAYGGPADEKKQLVGDPYWLGDQHVGDDDLTDDDDEDAKGVRYVDVNALPGDGGVHAGPVEGVGMVNAVGRGLNARGHASSLLAPFSYYPEDPLDASVFESVLRVLTFYPRHGLGVPPSDYSQDRLAVYREIAQCLGRVLERCFQKDPAFVQAMRPLLGQIDVMVYQCEQGARHDGDFTMTDRQHAAGVRALETFREQMAVIDRPVQQAGEGQQGDIQEDDDL